MQAAVHAVFKRKSTHTLDLGKISLSIILFSQHHETYGGEISYHKTPLFWCVFVDILEMLSAKVHAELSGSQGFCD